MTAARFGQHLMALLWVLILAASAPALAQTDHSGDELQKQTRQVSEITRQFAMDGADVDGLKQKIVRQRASLLELQASYRDERDRLISVLNRLGSPVEGEAPAITSQRKALNDQADAARAALEQIDQNLGQIARLEHEFEVARQDAFYSELTDRTKMMISPSSWGRAAYGVGSNLVAADQDISAWLADEDSGELNLKSALVLVGAFCLAFISALPLRHWLTRRLIDPLAGVSAGTDFGVLIGLLRVVLRSIPLVMSILMVSHTLTFLDLASPSLAIVLQSVWVALACIVGVSSLCSVFFSTSASMPPFRFNDSGKAVAIWSLVLTGASVIGLDHVLRTQFNVYGGAAEVDSVLRGITAILLAGVVLAILQAWKFEQSAEPELGEQAPLRIPGYLRSIISLAALISVPAALFGYSALSHFVTTRIVLLGGLWLAALIGQRALFEVLRAMLSAANRRHERVLSDDGDLMSFWLSLLSGILVCLLSIPAALLLIGFSVDSVQRILVQAVTGISIGKVQISLLQIAIAIFVFLAMIFATRLIQRTTQTRVLNRLKIDVGVQNSLKTLIGYIGLVIAFFTGVSLLGFDLSNLAIIAGALSVGIGFGLQSIVNNFVSGLILLFERPIKVGDWVVTTSGEGIVKKISVRSTEIETFDRASVLVPNSELISNSVTNWTHKNRLGRVTILVGVAYKEDPESILKLLGEIPGSIELALETPEPQTLFTGFGDSSLNFELRFFIEDVTQSVLARTQARIAVFNAFRDAGVEIPFPQRDLHVRSVPEGFLQVKRDEVAD